MWHFPQFSSHTNLEVKYPFRKYMSGKHLSSSNSDIFYSRMYKTLVYSGSKLKLPHLKFEPCLTVPIFRLILKMKGILSLAKKSHVPAKPDCWFKNCWYGTFIFARYELPIYFLVILEHCARVWSYGNFCDILCLLLLLLYSWRLALLRH